MRTTQLAHRNFATTAAPATGAVSVVQVQERQRRHASQSVLVIFVSTALAAVLLAVLSRVSVTFAAVVVSSPILMSALLIWLWRQPVRGVYVLFGAATVLPIYYRPDLPDIIGNALPFFPDINTWTHTKGFSFSLCEIFIVLVLVIWLLKSIAQRRLHFERGSLMLPLGLYILMVLIAWMHGLTSGANFTTSLWEIRGQAYMLLAYILICNLVTTRAHVLVLLWVLLVGAGVRGIEGSIRYLFIVRGSSAQELYPHEQSFFFNAFLTLTLILFVYGSPRRMKRFSLFLLPVVTFANLADERRAAILALIIAFMTFLVITYVAYPQRQRAVGLIMLGLAIFFPPYYLAFQHQRGILALPARAVASNFTPNTRDAQSNQYRLNENADIMFTMKTSKIIGYGFGKPMMLPYALPNISRIYTWWNIMPHNSILWVWMRLGTIGYLFLWFLLGSALVQSTHLVRSLREPLLKAFALFIVLLLIQQVAISYVDLQWSNWRTLITTGILFGLISRVTLFASIEEVSVADRPEPNESRSRSTARPSVPIPLTVVDGRREVVVKR